jgi:hypothetical protein
MLYLGAGVGMKLFGREWERLSLSLPLLVGLLRESRRLEKVVLIWEKVCRFCGHSVQHPFIMVYLLIMYRPVLIILVLRKAAV